MKIRFYPLLTLLLFAGSLLTGGAQTFTLLYTFSATNPSMFTNSDGANPEAGLIVSGGTLFGTTANGGSSGDGAVFAVNTDGSDFTNLHSFVGTDGSYPQAGLIVSGGTLFGTTANGGGLYDGTLFAVNTDGSDFTNLFSFSGTNGAYPYAGLVLSGGTLYGTTINGGDSYNGTLFMVNTDGTDFTNLYDFDGVNDGFESWGSLVMSGGVLYGTTSFGGSSDHGAVFMVNDDGSGYTNLYSFTTTENETNSDGCNPFAGLVLYGGKLYGTAYYGGSFGDGTVYRLNTDGSGFANLYSFSAESNGTNADGANPNATLVISGGTLYGTAKYGGSSGGGTVFQINTDGSGFTNLYSFSGTNGTYPYGGLVLSGGTLYGTTAFGGSFGNGTVFSLSLLAGPVTNSPPVITGISLAGTNLVLAGSNGLSGQTNYLLMSTNIALPVSQWTLVATNIFSASGSFTLTATNVVSPNAPQQFYRLQLP